VVFYTTKSNRTQVCIFIFKRKKNESDLIERYFGMLLLRFLVIVFVADAVEALIEGEVFAEVIANPRSSIEA
jgi:hypothetical protein